MLFLDSKIRHLSRKSLKDRAGFMKRNDQRMIRRQVGWVEKVEEVYEVEMVEKVISIVG